MVKAVEIIVIIITTTAVLVVKVVIIMRTSFAEEEEEEEDLCSRAILASVSLGILTVDAHTPTAAMRF